MSMNMLIKGARIVDPAASRDEISDLLVLGGRIAEPASAPPADIEVYDAAGMVLCPGLIDIHVHLREPGGEQAETVATGSRAAARGGFTTVVGMPNTTPALDSPDWVRRIMDLGAEAGHCKVLTSACITKERAGKTVANLEALADAGAVAFTDDGCTVQADDVMEEAMRRACQLGITLMDHAQDRNIELQGGVMHEGEVSRRAGLPGIPTLAETRIIARNIRLSEVTGCAVHIQHVTSAEGAELIADARRRGLPVSGEASPHHLALSDEDIDPGDADYKMNPPLRTPADRTALRRAVIEGDLEAFATDHAPHPADRKALGFVEAPFGIVGLETAVGVTYTELVQPGHMSLAAFVERWTTAPSRILALPPPGLAVGSLATLALLDITSRWKVEPEQFASRSRNTPFKGRALTGRAVLTAFEGAVTWRQPVLGQPVDTV